ncbi:MAG: hypothetical protein ACP5UQ_04565, partial [Anaerolineae bacterium]
YDVDAGHLKYARQGGGVWTSETVDASPGTGLYTSLALDSTAAAHISYQDGYEFDLKYAFRSPAGWQIETVDAGGEVGAHTAIAVDGAGRPHISYYDATAQTVKHATPGASGWILESIEPVGPTTATALALDAAGAVHIAYVAGQGAAALRYASRLDDGWQIETVTAAGDLGGRIGLAFDAGNVPYISYYDFASRRVLVAHREPTGWAVQVVADGVGESQTTLALDRSGAVLIAFYDAAAGDLKFARTGAEAGSWDIASIVGAGDVGAYPSLKLDAAGRPWISFHDVTNGDLLIARGPDEARAILLPLLLRSGR